MYEAAIVILHRVKRASQLRDWALAIAQRAGPGKARVALARKLAVILHSVWRWRAVSLVRRLTHQNRPAEPDVAVALGRGGEIACNVVPPRSRFSRRRLAP